jgi:hypothetical protein
MDIVTSMMILSVISSTSVRYFPAITATTFSDSVVAGSRRINPHQTVGVALPCHKMLGKTVTIITRHGSIRAPVVDVGPWNTGDSYIQELRRPRAESGQSSLRRFGYRARNKAGVDCTPALWKALGLGSRERTEKVGILIFELGVLLSGRI